MCKFLKSFNINLQMKKMIFFFVAVAFVSKVHTQQPPILPVINFDMSEFNAQARDHQQMHMQQPGPNHQHMQIPHIHQQGREASAAENEPMVGSPLVGSVNLGSPLGWGLGGLGHPLNPFGLGGIPGLRFSNFQAGHLGNLAFGNSLLGAGNPMANDDDQPMPPPMSQQMEQLGSPHLQEAEQVGAPQESQGLWPFWWLHLANPDSNHDSNLGAPVPLQHMEAENDAQLEAIHKHYKHHHLLGAPNMQQMDQTLENSPPQGLELRADLPPMDFPNHPQQLGGPQMMPQMFDQMQPIGPPMPQQMEMPNILVQPEDNARHWGKWSKKLFKGYGDSYG